MTSDSNNNSAEVMLRRLIESAGEDRVKAGSRQRLGLAQARDTLDTLIEEAGLDNAELLEAQLETRHSTQRAMRALFMIHPSGEFVDLNGDDGVVDEDGHPPISQNRASPLNWRNGTNPSPSSDPRVRG